MPFDIRHLDRLEEYNEEAFDAYQDALLNLFLDSPEAEAHMAEYPDAGFWAAQFMYYGYAYIGYTLPKTTRSPKKSSPRCFLEKYPSSLPKTPTTLFLN